jgi:hypothetical protein
MRIKRDTKQLIEQFASQPGVESEEFDCKSKEIIELPFIADYEADDPKGKYRKLDSNILKPLVNDGAVIITEKGREKVAQVTADGENTLHAFRYMTNSDTNL